MTKHIPAFGLIIMAICLLPASVFAAFDKEPAGRKATPIQHPKVTEEQLEENAQLADGLPEKLDPRNEAWFQQNIRVRNQAGTELCWAFAATSAAQISYVKETWDSEAATLVPELSPVHLGFFFYNRVNDPLGNTAKDENCLTGDDDWVGEGGANVYTFQHLATWSGPRAEDDATTFSFDPDTNAYTGPETLERSLAYSNALTLQNSEYYEELPYTDTGINTIKNMIGKYGAVVTGLDWESKFVHVIKRTEEGEEAGEGTETGETEAGTKTEKSFYDYSFDPEVDGANHEVTIIGWDDQYPKENFAKTGSSAGTGSQTTAKLPSRDGAWLVMNSWGTDDEGDGYFWLSYDSKEYMTQGLLGLDMQPADPDRALYQYDGTAFDGYEDLKASDIVANIFTAPADRQIRLDEVGFTTWNPASSNYEVTIYTGLASKTKPTSGQAQTRQKVTTESAGYKTFALDAPVTIDAGETFAVAVKCLEANTFGMEYTYEDDNVYYAKAGLAAGQSFLYRASSGKWYDAATDRDGCYRIKAITEDAACIHDYQETSRVDAQKGVDGYLIEECQALVGGKKCGRIKETVLAALKPVPEKTKITKLVKAKKAMTVKWKKSAEKIAGKNIDGYQIRYSLKKSMKNSKKVTVKGYKVTSKKIKKLKSKKKYYVQIRTYKKTEGKTYYSAWSAKKSVKTK